MIAVFAMMIPFRVPRSKAFRAIKYLLFIRTNLRDYFFDLLSVRTIQLNG